MGWYSGTLFFFCIVFVYQIISITMLVKSYKTIRDSKDILGLEQSGEQSNQLCLMLFNIVLIGASYLMWFISDSVVLFFSARRDFTLKQAIFYDSLIRLIRIFCQMIALCWILYTFSRWGVKVDRKIERRKRKSSVRKAPKVEVHMVDTLS